MSRLMSDVQGALELAVTYLVSKQEDNGSFVDFLLPPGPSDGWITGFVAVAIDEALRFISMPEGRSAVLQAAQFLANNQRPSGWGYNGLTATDGDSTAFALRALLRAGYTPPTSPETLLQAYIDECGHGHTFLNPNRMGTWAGQHVDVTASIGLALQESNASRSLRNLVVNASLASRNAQGIWTGFWWLRPYYTTWMNLMWLRAADALTQTIARSARLGVFSQGGDLSAMDAAALIGIVLEISRVTNEPVPEEIVYRFMQLQQPDGGWPSSYCLILPSQRPENGKDVAGGKCSEVQCFADVRSLFTTAVAAQVLACWYRYQRCSSPMPVQGDTSQGIAGFTT